MNGVHGRVAWLAGRLLALTLTVALLAPAAALASVPPSMQAGLLEYMGFYHFRLERDDIVHRYPREDVTYVAIKLASVPNGVIIAEGPVDPPPDWAIDDPAAFAQAELDEEVAFLTGYGAVITEPTVEAARWDPQANTLMIAYSFQDDQTAYSPGNNHPFWACIRYVYTEDEGGLALPDERLLQGGSGPGSQRLCRTLGDRSPRNMVAEAIPGKNRSSVDKAAPAL